MFALRPEIVPRGPARGNTRASASPFHERLEELTVDRLSVMVCLLFVCSSCATRNSRCFSGRPNHPAQSVAALSESHSLVHPNDVSNFRLPSRCKTENPACLSPACDG